MVHSQFNSDETTRYMYFKEHYTNKILTDQQGYALNPHPACKGVHTVPHPPLYDVNPLIQKVNTLVTVF